MVTVHIHRDFKIYHNHLIVLILRDHAKVRRAKNIQLDRVLFGVYVYQNDNLLTTII